MATLRFERLEDRVLLTAVARQSGDTLRITGDGAGDNIRVVNDGGAGMIGVDLDGNGSIDVTVDGISRVIIDTKGGDDTVTVDGIVIGGDLIINTRNGGDTINICNGVVVGDELRVDTGNGNDHLTLKDGVTIIGNTSIRTGNGGDSVGLRGGVTLGGNVGINTGNQGDSLTMEDTQIEGCTRVRLGRGNDTFNLGNDFEGDDPTGETRLGRKFRLDAGRGNDGGNIIQIGPLGGDDSYSLSGGPGNDGLGAPIPVVFHGEVVTIAGFENIVSINGG